MQVLSVGIHIGICTIRYSLQHRCNRKSLQICVLLADRKILCNHCKMQDRGHGLFVRQ